MSYYKKLGLNREPFSTSPDPDFLYLSKAHDQALTNVLIELHLRRGLSVILGDIGTGKTTLSRKMIQCLRQKGNFELNIILDPYFKSERLFLISLLSNFNDDVERFCPGSHLNELNVLELKQILQKFLYEKCVVDGRTVVVIIDEAQKLSRSSLEMLRVMLNYETNQNKLLQLVLLGQTELHPKIMDMPNFYDRISFKYALSPFDLKETRDMIGFRMHTAGYTGGRNFFLDEAVEAIHEISGGYPRKTTLYCHKALKAAVSKERWAVDELTVRQIIEEERSSGWLKTTLN